MPGKLTDKLTIVRLYAGSLASDGTRMPFLLLSLFLYLKMIAKGISLHPFKKGEGMKALYTVGLLVISNIFMTFAWYGHLKLKQEFSWFASLPLIGVIVFSWSIAFLEYLCQVPANRIGFAGNGGPFSLMQLKVMQEAITLIVFTVFSTVLFKGEVLHWNHLLAFLCLILAVYFVFME